MPGQTAVKSARKVLLFRAGGRACAIDVAHVVETMRSQPVEPVTGAPTFVSGVAIVRGQAIPVVDTAVLFGVRSATAGRRFLVVRVGARAVALAVEEVTRVVNLSAIAQELPPLLRDVEESALVAVSRLDGELLFVLQTCALLDDDAFSVILSVDSR